MSCEVVSSGFVTVPVNELDIVSPPSSLARTDHYGARLLFHMGMWFARTVMVVEVDAIDGMDSDAPGFSTLYVLF
jgi:hypothetical protein